MNLAAGDANERAAFIMMLRRYGVRDTKLLSAMELSHREHFLEGEAKARAYRNTPLPLACGQMIERPSLAARFVEALNLQPHHTLLEVGAGSGWLTSIFSHLVTRVVAVECYKTLCNFAAKNLSEQGVTNAKILQGDGIKGVPEVAPFDRIFVSLGVEVAPPALLQQLKAEGEMLCMLPDEKGCFHLTRFTKSSPCLKEERLFAVQTTLLEMKSAAFL